MNLHFFGAAGEVTGSCYLLETSRARVLIDFGLHQGGPRAERRNRRVPPIEPEHLSAVVVTHAHIDHTGRLPLLIRNRYERRIYATPATCDLTEILLADSAKLQEADAERASRKRLARRRPPVYPLYTSEDAAQVQRLLSPVPYDQPKEIAPGVTLRYVDAGHILGSASVELTIREAGEARTIVFSGDLGEDRSPLLKDPTPLYDADAVVMESTYGDRDHRGRAESIDELAQVIDSARAEDGKVLIPAFAVGRTQQLIYQLGELVRAGRFGKGSLAVFIDSPMAIEATSLYRRHTHLFDDESHALIGAGHSPLSFPGLSFVRSVQDSMRLNQVRHGTTIIAASGMCTGGRILHHLRHALSHPATHVVIVGYQAEGTLGRRLVDGATSARVLGEEVLVKAKVHTIGGFSAHSGQTGLVRWASHFVQGERAATPPRLFLTHGEPRARDILRDKIRDELSLSAECPEWNDAVML
ncbi:MAG: MBL fold metallo-hydrolase [Phycisphaerales bacterium]